MFRKVECCVYIMHFYENTINFLLMLFGVSETQWWFIQQKIVQRDFWKKKHDILQRGVRFITSEPMQIRINSTYLEFVNSITRQTPSQTLINFLTNKLYYQSFYPREHSIRGSTNSIRQPELKKHMIVKQSTVVTKHEEPIFIDPLT